MGKADLHIHSDVSDGMASVPRIMDYVCDRTDLDLVAIVDHDAVAGCYQALNWWERQRNCRFRVVFGTEITTALGRHLLAYFFQPPYPTQPLPQLRSYARTIDLVHDLGGVVAIPHPTVMWTPSGGYRNILRLLHSGARVDAIEVCNAAPGARGKAEKVALFNDRDFHLSPLGGSDAHHLAQIGSAYTCFEGKSPAGFLQALQEGTTRACWGAPGRVTPREHLRQLLKSWVEKPARGLRRALAQR